MSRDAEAGRLVHMGWSGKELLYCVYENGVVDVCVGLGAVLLPVLSL